MDKPDFPLTLGSHAADGEIGDAAGLKPEAGVGDVDLFRENRDSDRLDASKRRVDEIQDDV